MAQIQLELSDIDSEALRRLADRCHAPVAGLLADYVAYLLSGGPPVASFDDSELRVENLTALPMWGGTLSWLAEEPELYSPDDGEPL